MSLAVEIAIPNAAALDGVTELFDSPSVNKQVTDQGVVVLTLNSGQAFGIFDPGVFVGGQRPDYFVQSLQVSSSGGTPGGFVELVGPLGPTPAPAPRFPFATLSSTSLDTYVEAMRAVPAGYKLAFTTTATGPHLVRLTLWPMKNTEEAIRAGQLSASVSVSSTPTGPAGGQLGGTYPNPDVRGLRETTGPTLLSYGAVSDGLFLQRSGTTVVGATPNAAGPAGGQLGGAYPNPDVRGLRETSGPTLLSYGAVASGQFLQRSGSNVVGATPNAAGPAGGQLGGTYPNPDVRGLRETSGPTLLTLGAIADGEFLKRSGGNIVGGTAGGTNLNLQYAELETEHTNNTQTFATALTLTTASLPSADYLLFWQTHSATDTLTRKVLRIFQDGTTTLDDLTCDFDRSNDQREYAGVKKLASLSGVHTFALQHRMDEILGTSRVLRTRLALIRVS